jgi:hypothetical protein
MAAPDAATNVKATDGSLINKVTITWTQSAGANIYHVYRDSVDYATLGDVATYDDTVVETGKVYSYQIKAFTDADGAALSTADTGWARSGTFPEQSVMPQNPDDMLKMDHLVAKTSSSPLTTGNLFKFKGKIAIVSLIGTIITGIQAQTTNVKLSVVCDSLDAYDICANKDIVSFAVGSLISITGTAANAAVSTTAVGAMAPGQASIVTLTCITEGYITVTYGAASTGAIVWDLKWEPLSVDASVVAV